jgi:hypothetical protein
MPSGRSKEGLEWNGIHVMVYADDVNILGKNINFINRKTELYWR